VNESPYSQGATAFIRFKSAALADQYWADLFHPALYVVLLAAAHWHYTMTGSAMTITSLWRPDGIHKCFRAADVRTRQLYPLLVEQWENWINSVFQYHGAAGCRTALVHDVGRGSHMHIQVGPMESTPKWES